MLSKYHEKKKQKLMKTESGRIAYAMWEKREDLWHRYLDEDEELDLGDGITISQEGLLSFVISKKIPEKGSRYWVKVLPSYEQCIDKIVDMLDTQDWGYF